MNALGFVFSILMILSFGFSICVGKQLSDQRLRLTYRGHSHANRLILAQCERALYRSLPQKPSPSKPKKAVASQKKSMKTPNPKINPKCAQINLAPLLEKGREDEPLLYDTTAKLLKLFYGKALFENKPHAEFHFLKVFVEAMKATKAKQKFFALEKVQFKSGLIN